MAEEGRISIRAARKEGMDAGKKMKSDNTVTEDGQRDFEAEVQALTDKATKDLDALVTAKEKEVMTV